MGTDKYLLRIKNWFFPKAARKGFAKLGAWDIGERYGYNIIDDMNNRAVAWTNWNMVLDETGGPNHVGNYCDAPIIADTSTDTVIYESSYYYHSIATLLY